MNFQKLNHFLKLINDLQKKKITQRAMWQPLGIPRVSSTVSLMGGAHVSAPGLKEEGKGLSWYGAGIHRAGSVGPRRLSLAAQGKRAGSGCQLGPWLEGRLGST